MTAYCFRNIAVTVVWGCFFTGIVFGQAGQPEKIHAPVVDTWVDVTGQAAGEDLTAQDQAIADGLRKAVEQACGTFLTAQSKSQDYQLVYDRIFANTVGFVRKHKEKRIYIEDGITHARLSVHVSTQKFQEDWAVIAHTLAQEGNPRVILVVTDATWTEDPTPTTAPAEQSLSAGVVQSKLEDFFLSKGVMLMDRSTAVSVNKRDIILAGMQDDVRQLAALGARFKADVVLFGQTSARYGNTVRVADHDMHKFVATLNVRAIRTDSAHLIVSKTYGPATATSLQHGGGREKALAKLAEDSAPDLLAAVVEAWRKQVHIARDIQLQIAGMDFEAWRTFLAEAKKMRGLQSLNLKEITEDVAHATVQYEFDTQTLAEKLSQLTETKLKVVEFNPNRLKLERITTNDE